MSGAAWWLLKTEPGEFSLDDLRRRGRAVWDGVRSYQARNQLRAMRVDDHVLVYHSSCRPPGVAGLARVTRAAFPDPAQWDPASPYHDPASPRSSPRWDAVEVGFVEAFASFLPINALRAEPRLGGMALFRYGRLSVQPVTAGEAALILALARQRG